MTTDAIRCAAFELGRISAALSEIEIISHQKMTYGRAKRVLQLQDTLSRWSDLDLRMTMAVAVDLVAIRDAGLKQLAPTIDAAYMLWRQRQLERVRA